MSTAKTAAAIGIQFTADPKQVDKALTDLDKKIGGLGKSRWASDLRADAKVLSDAGAASLRKFAGAIPEAAAGAIRFSAATAAIGATAAVVGLGVMAVSLGETGAAAGRAADRLGMPVERLSQFQIAARLAGSSAEDMTGSLIGLQSTVADAAYGRNNDAWSVFHAAGIDIGNAKDGAKDYAAILPKIADETRKLASVDRNAALRFLDKVGVSRDLFPVLRNGSAGLQDYLNQAQQFGPMTQKQAEDGRALEKVMTELGLRFESFERIAGGAVAPGLTKFLDTLQTFLQSHQSDVVNFFDSVEHGIEWLMTPKNISWLREELDKTSQGIQALGRVAEGLEHSFLFRKMFGLPEEGIGPGNGLLSPPGAPGAADTPTLSPDIGSAPQNERSKQAMAYFISQGMSPGAAAGIVGNLQAESGFRPEANNGSHAGIAQWDATRQAEIEAHFGKRVQDMKFPEQLAAVNWELTQGRYSGVGDKLKGNIDPSTAATIVNHGYEIPALPGTPAMQREDAMRTALARNASEHYTEDAGLKRFTDDANAAASPAPAQGAADPNAATPSYVQPGGTAADTDGRMSKIQVELRHVNPPAGAEMSVINADPSQIDVIGPKVMGSMPNSGQGRSIAKNGYYGME